MTTETPNLEELMKNAYISKDREKLNLVVGVENNSPNKEISRVHYHEYIVSSGEYLTEWRVSYADFNRINSVLATPDDLWKVRHRSKLYLELQKRNLIHSDAEIEALMTGSD